MQRTISVFVMAVVLISMTTDTLGQSRLDYTKVNPLRWMDPYRSPITYQEYNSRREFDLEFRAELIHSGNKGVIPICIVINTLLQPQIQTSFSQYLSDLATDGYNVNVYTATNNGDEVALRNLLISEWNTRNLVGAILIGDLAVPWYEMTEPVSWGGAHVEFPIDLFYMDLDGQWVDADADGIYDEHLNGSGDMTADVWVGRLLAKNLTLNGATEPNLMNNYFSKNHRYRTGDLRLMDKALAYLDNDWCCYGWEYDVALAYPNTYAVTDLYQTNRTDYIQRVRKSTNNQYENLLITSHSSPWAHYLYWGTGPSDYSLFYNYEIEQIDVQVLFYNLFACSNCRYVESDDMGNWYLFQSTYGLISLGATKTGSMLCFEDYYAPLGYGESFGNAFLSWGINDIENCGGSDSRAWFYGMTLLGDPTLKLSRFLPDYTGDLTEDGAINSADIIFLVNYLFRGGPAPDPIRLGDANADCVVNTGDIILLVNYLYAGGPAPLRGCA